MCQNLLRDKLSDQMLTAEDRWRLVSWSSCQWIRPHVNVNMFQFWYNWNSIDLDIYVCVCIYIYISLNKKGLLILQSPSQFTIEKFQVSLTIATKYVRSPQKESLSTSKEYKTSCRGGELIPNKQNIWLISLSQFRDSSCQHVTNGISIVYICLCWWVCFKLDFPGGLKVKNFPAMQETWVWSLCQEDLEEGMTTHSSILAWRIPWTENPEGYSPQGC